MSTDSPASEEVNSPHFVFGFVLAFFGLFGTIALVVALLLGTGDDAGADGQAAAPTATGSQTLDITLADLSVTPGVVDVPAGTDLTLKVTNKGAIPHNLTVENGPKTPDLAPGEAAELHVGTVSKASVAYCSIPGHRAAGMVLQVNVTPSDGSPPTGHDSTTAGSAHEANSTDPADAKIDFNATPAPDWRPFDPRLAPAPDGTEHEIALHMAEQVQEVSPGVTQERWTFNGQVPGPILRGKVGDLFTVTVTNDGKMAHSIDFHASQTSMDDDMRPLQPGESLVYQFKAEFSGIWMYHCGVSPALHHIGNGMFGAVIIDPPDLAPVDHEYVIVQSELYTGPTDQPADFAKMLANQPDAVMFNGYVNQYKYAPITDVKAGERVRIWVLDAGPSDLSSFHIVGTIFDTVFKEGAYLLRPDNLEHGGSQALDLAPAQGGFVELTFAKAGMYDMVTHKFVDATRGGLGIFEVS